jgi:hypothetical protein
MSNPIIRHLEVLIERLMGDPADRPELGSPDLPTIESFAELAAHAEPAPSPYPPFEPLIALHAAYVQGALSAGQAEPVVELLARSAAARLETEALIELLEGQGSSAGCAPDEVVSAALDALESARGVRLLRPSVPVPPAPESFLPLAAASSGGQRPLCCRSQSGIWTLEVFIGEVPQNAAEQQAQLLLSVHAEHRTTYEGLVATVYVGSGETARILAEEVVRNGEVYAAFMLRDLDFWSRDAVSVTFEPVDRSG